MLHFFLKTTQCCFKMQNDTRIPNDLNKLTSCIKCHSACRAQIMKKQLEVLHIQRAILPHKKTISLPEKHMGAPLWTALLER